MSDEPDPCGVGNMAFSGPARLCFFHATVNETIAKRKLDDANKEVARLRRQLERTVSIASWIADRAWVNGSRDHDEGGWDRACPFFLSGPNDGSCDRCGHEKDSHDE